jgi:hypothetical protein
MLIIRAEYIALNKTNLLPNFRKNPACLINHNNRYFCKLIYQK